MQARLARIGRAALDLLLPPACLTCDAPVSDPGQFCADCFRATGFITEPCCTHCGVPFADARERGPHRLCPVCLLDPPPWGRARAALRYDAHSRHIILPFKHGDRTETAPALARMMVRAGAALLAEADLLVPVPLHRARLISRRYNQAALLAHAVGRIADLPTLPDALFRTRRTKPLGELGADARARMVEGAFAVRPRRLAAIAGRHVLLIDDVLTSGATTRACTKTLLAAGAAGVDVLVAARVPDPRLN
jgi:ComF family protein